MLDDGLRYRFLALLQQNPNLSQRAIAKCLGISLGKVNYCLKALISKGWVKALEFCRDGSKKSYAYILTPEGLEEKALVTLRFLKRKIREYEQIQEEIERLKKEVRDFRED